MLKKTSFWVAIAAVALVGLSLSGGSVAFADPPPCPPADRPCGPGGPPADPPGNGVGPHGAFGVVSQKDPATDTNWVLLTKQGPVNITTNGDTKCKIPGTKGPGTDEDCDQILNGHYVSVQGTPNGESAILAKRINLNRGRSLHEHCIGDIEAFTGTLTSGTITVACRTDGQTFTRTFTVGASTKFAKDVDSLEDLLTSGVGDTNDEVMVVAARDGLLASDLYTAKVVHKVAD